MKRFLIVLAALPILVYGTNAWCDSVGSLSEFASNLSKIREGCTNLAQGDSDSFKSASFQATLDDQTAQTKAEMDAKVYGVGHGNRETTDYLLNRMQENNEASSANRKRISDKMQSDAAEVQKCIEDGEQAGKSDYSAFKADKKHKKMLSDAESLMTAWLTNLKEITLDAPEGSDATKAAWKTAQTHAELSSL